MDDVPYQAESDLFNEFERCAEQLEPLPSEEETTQPSKKRPGRKSLPKELPRDIVDHDLSDEEKQCACGSEMEYMGTQTSEELNYKPAKLTVTEHHCKKYACTTCNKANKKDPATPPQFKTASKPKQLIPKSYATPSLLASIVISKFCDHLPLYRLETIFKRLSISLWGVWSCGQSDPGAL